MADWSFFRADSSKAGHSTRDVERDERARQTGSAEVSGEGSVGERRLVGRLQLLSDGVPRDA